MFHFFTCMGLVVVTQQAMLSGRMSHESSCLTCGSKVNLTHIRHFRRIQAHWQAYDAYARVCVAMGTNQLLGWVYPIWSKLYKFHCRGHGNMGICFIINFFRCFQWVWMAGFNWSCSFVSLFLQWLTSEVASYLKLLG